MPCPFFVPVKSLGELNPGATPLGDLFGGECGADRQYEIPNDLLRNGCNFGYARDRCELARQSPDDATSFILAAGKVSTALVVRWAIERDHHPVAVGQLDTSGISGLEPLEAQARAYFSVYQRRQS